MLNRNELELLESIAERGKKLLADMEKASSAGEISRLVECGKEYARLEEKMKLFEKYKELESKLNEDKEIIAEETDKELILIARAESEELEKKLAELTVQLRELLRAPDKDEDRGVIMEIRAGTGGEEATLFVGDLFRMYSSYIESRGWKLEVISTTTQSGLGGHREIIFSVSGKGAYRRLKYESGVHRVQRIPVTESGGRIHTSAATVAVLPEPKELEVVIRPEELKIDTFRASGHGGQHVNKTESAVRITHIPTGLVVSCQDEKSQFQNRAKAMKVLKSRLWSLMQEQEAGKRQDMRRQQVRSGDRSEKIRTYNFPQNRVTDHRIGLTLYKLESIIAGELDPLLEALEQSDLRKETIGNNQ